VTLITSRTIVAATLSTTPLHDVARPVGGSAPSPSSQRPSRQ